ncbi:MAG: response regulator receiver [Puniceicoccaceae bacterium 5H]|nr:MAG: response regulator receiver [Puniceicoccaceae bacterium 5H]
MNPKRIMLVDDQQIANFILRKLLSKHAAQADVHDFTAPEKAIEDVARLNPDVIFLDLNMPVLDGWAFLDQMQERQLGHAVVVVTSSTSEVDRSRALTYPNVRHYCSKPVPAEALQQALG